MNSTHHLFEKRTKIGRELASLARRQDTNAHRDWKKHRKAATVADPKPSDAEGRL